MVKENSSYKSEASSAIAETRVTRFFGYFGNLRMTITGGENE